MIFEGKDRIFCKKQTLNCGGKLIDLSTPKVMGILNVTPDSFYDGGKYNHVKMAVEHVADMLQLGADFIDIGGYSSRPGASLIDEAEEHNRVIPHVCALRREFPELILSIDTFRSSIARVAVNEGVSIVNDISGGEFDKEMFNTVAGLNVPYIMMHMRGNPQNMQKDTRYNDLIEELIIYFKEKLKLLEIMGVRDVIIDPGFGFAKSLEGNYSLLHQLKTFGIFEKPIMVGLSRKSMIKKLLGTDGEKALKGTMALNLTALIEGATILRVHDVKQGREMIELYQRLVT